MTSFNYEKFITQAIESVINQTVSDWELIIIDDGSKDNSLNIIKNYAQQDERIKLFTHENNENRGLCASVRLGLEKAENDWVAFLESDDFWAKNYLEEKTAFIENHPETVLVYNDIECFGYETRVSNTKPYFEKIHKIWENSETQDMFNYFGTNNYIPTFSCVMCKKETLLTCDLNPQCKPLLDYWIWWQMAEKGDFGFVKQKLTHWRMHKKSYLAKEAKTIKHFINRFSFVNKINKLFTREPKLCTKYKLEKNILLAGIIYFFLYVKRKIPQPIKNLFMAR